MSCRLATVTTYMVLTLASLYSKSQDRMALGGDKKRLFVTWKNGTDAMCFLPTLVAGCRGLKWQF
jgi:hypothetical protein